MERMTASLIRDYIPMYYMADTDYYALKDKENIIGVLSVKRLTETQCECGFFILSDCKGRVRTYKKYLSMMRFPLTLGYKTVILWSQNAMRGLMRMFDRFGLKYSHTDGGRDFFIFKED